MPNVMPEIIHQLRFRHPRSLRVLTLLLLACCIVLASGEIAGASAHARPRRKRVVPIIFYSSIGYDQAVAKAFTNKYHIPVKIDHNATGTALALIEATRNNPQWGMWWTDGPTNMTLLDNQRMLVRHFEPSDAHWTRLGLAQVPKDKSYVPTGVTIAAALVYDKTKVANPPKSWLGLLQPKWKNRVGMNNPAISGPTYPFLTGMMQSLGGIKQGEDYFSALKSNGLLINPKNGETLSALTSGQISLALVQSSAGIGAEASDHNLAVSYPAPATILPSVVGIDSKAPKLERQECEKFISFIFSKAGYEARRRGDPAGDSLYYPIVKGQRALPQLPSLTKVKTLTTNPFIWGRHEAGIDSWFTTNVVQ